MYSVIFHRRQNKYQFQKLKRFSQGNHDINITIRIIGFSGNGGQNCLETWTGVRKISLIKREKQDISG